MERKLFIHHGYDNVESGPAEDVGPARGRKLLRLLFIPFMYATPTYGDVVSARKDAEFEGHYAFECPNEHGMEIDDLHEHGGRFALIVDFHLGADDSAPWFPESDDVMTSLAWPEEKGTPGRLYIAAQTTKTPASILDSLVGAHPSATFTLIHPEDEG